MRFTYFRYGSACAFVVLFAAPLAAAQRASDDLRTCLASHSEERTQAACIEKAISDYCRRISYHGGDRIGCLTGILNSIERTAANDGDGRLDDASRMTANDGATPQRLGASSRETTAATADGQADSFGAEQIAPKKKFGERAEEKKAQALRAGVARLFRTSRGTYVFHLDNGQVWRQKDSDPARLLLSGSREYSVTISKGLFSGYRLKIDGLPRRILVERTE